MANLTAILKSLQNIHPINIWAIYNQIEFISQVYSLVFTVVTVSYIKIVPDSKVHGADMGPTWVLSAPGGPHVDLMNLVIWGAK